MALVTLIGENQAKEGYEFIFVGPVPDCKDCKLKTVCFSLREGHRYRVKAVRPIKHECRIHEVGVRIVEVEEVPMEVCLPEGKAIEGAIVSIERSGCSDIGCSSFRTCSQAGVKEGAKYKVLEVRGAVDCPQGKRIKRVVVG